VQHLRTRRPAGLVLLSARDLQLLEQDRAELLRGSDVERLAREIVDAPLQARRRIVDLAREDEKLRGIDRDAGGLHLGQDRRERDFDVPVQRELVALFELCPHDGNQLERGIGIGGSVVRERAVEIGDGRVARAREIPRGWIEQMRGDHRIVGVRTGGDTARA